VRGVPLERRSAILRWHADSVTEVDGERVFDVWKRALSARPWSGPPLWIHGDCHPGNLVVNAGRLSAVVDFGDLTAGDPATDLAVAWMLLPTEVRSIFRKAAQGPFDPVDDDTWIRARAWALALGLAFAANSAHDEELRRTGLATIDAVLDDAPCHDA
jgi:aminoglycoside phosphotransferase (APT) family kinase protein